MFSILLLILFVFNISGTFLYLDSVFFNFFLIILLSTTLLLYMVNSKYLELKVKFCIVQLTKGLPKIIYNYFLIIEYYLILLDFLVYQPVCLLICYWTFYS